MKTVVLLTFFFVFSAMARPIVLISYYDPFEKSPANNSEAVAKKLAEHYKSSPVEIRLCPLKTIFDKAYEMTEACLKELPKAPILLLGLGESFCSVKAEVSMKNYNYVYAADNAGNRPRGVIIEEAPRFLGLNYPLGDMYCALNEQERNRLDISSDAGTFVCNNTAFRLSYNHPTLISGFIHVPAHDCRGLEEKNSFAVNVIGKMIDRAVEVIQEENLASRMPVTKKGIKALLESEDDDCKASFLEEIKPVDQRGLW